MNSDPVMWMIFAGVGAGFAGLGVFLVCHVRPFRQRAVRCPGVLVDVRQRWQRTSRGSGLFYYPVLEFRTADGRVVRTEVRSGSNRWPGDPGTEVQVSYDPRDPSRAYHDDGAVTLLVGSLFAGVGGLFLTIGLTALSVVGLAGG